jgi:hypothetical protein
MGSIASLLMVLSALPSRPAVDIRLDYSVGLEWITRVQGTFEIRKTIRSEPEPETHTAQMRFSGGQFELVSVTEVTQVQSGYPESKSVDFKRIAMKAHMDLKHLQRDKPRFDALLDTTNLTKALLSVNPDGTYAVLQGRPTEFDARTLAALEYELSGLDPVIRALAAGKGLEVGASFEVDASSVGSSFEKMAANLGPEDAYTVQVSGVERALTVLLESVKDDVAVLTVKGRPLIRCSLVPSSGVSGKNVSAEVQVGIDGELVLDLQAKKLLAHRSRNEYITTVKGISSFGLDRPAATVLAVNRVAVSLEARFQYD